MSEIEKVDFYDLHKLIIHPAIKTGPETKPLWRKIFWTTPKDSEQYKAGCVDIFEAHFPDLFMKLIQTCGNK